ncbi:MAG TPA: hypothetical protein VG102_02700 [Candidatus Paceibacterota bacterium]|jgi:hypothetical protein|nr:hypothetical protein [Candidatus Paceibacterota bacterium]
MPKRSEWKAIGFEVVGLEVKKVKEGEWVANAVGQNARGQKGINLIPTKSRRASHGSEEEALASVMEWIHS